MNLPALRVDDSNYVSGYRICIKSKIGEYQRTLQSCVVSIYPDFVGLHPTILLVEVNCLQ